MSVRVVGRFLGDFDTGKMMTEKYCFIQTHFEDETNMS